MYVKNEGTVMRLHYSKTTNILKLIHTFVWLLIFENSDTRLKRDLAMFHQLKITYKTSARRVKNVGNLEIRVFSIVLE